jgi:hypothetical protein
MSQVFNTFPPLTTSIGGTTVTVATVQGYFYDMKDHVKFNVSMEVHPDYTLDSFTISIDRIITGSGDTSSPKTITIFDTPRTVNGYNLVRTIYKGTSTLDDVYEFQNEQEHKIIYIAFFRLRTGPVFGNVSLKSTSHIQLFTYYATPATLSDFSVTNDVASGDSIEIAGLHLIRSSVDDSVPDYFTFTFQDNDAEPGDDNNRGEFDESYIVRQEYSPSGNYTLPSNTLANGSTYNMTVSAQYALGYGTSQTEPDLLIFNRPSIASIAVLPLYLRNTSDNVATVTLSALEGDDTLTKLWFQFKTTDGSDILVATVGGDTGIDYNSSSLEYSFSLSDIVKESTQSLYIENDISYNVVVKAQYVYNDENIIRYSSPYAVTFALTEPVISNIVVNSLYTVDASANIATITVDHDAYELYAPHATDGIKFVFYNGETEVEQTRMTSATRHQGRELPTMT